MRAAAAVAAAVVAQKGRRRQSADSRGAAGAENAEQDAEDAADAGQAVKGRARAKDTEDAGSWLRARVRRGQSMLLHQAQATRIMLLLVLLFVDSWTFFCGVDMELGENVYGATSDELHLASDGT